MRLNKFRGWYSNSEVLDAWDFVYTYVVTMVEKGRFVNRLKHEIYRLILDVAGNNTCMEIEVCTSNTIGLHEEPSRISPPAGYTNQQVSSCTDNPPHMCAIDSRIINSHLHDKHAYMEPAMAAAQ